MQSSGSTRFDTTHGMVAGGGIEFGSRHLRVTPEVRYTRWNDDALKVFGSRGYFVSSSQNEVKVLLGLWWR